MKGAVDVGFEIDREPKYVVRLSRGNAIGAMECTFDSKNPFIYKVKEALESYYIRKAQWKDLVNNSAYKELTLSLKEKIRSSFSENIESKIMNKQQ